MKKNGEREAAAKRNLFDELVEGMQALREERMKVKPINTEKEYKADESR